MYWESTSYLSDFLNIVSEHVRDIVPIYSVCCYIPQLIPPCTVWNDETCSLGMRGNGCETQTLSPTPQDNVTAVTVIFSNEYAFSFCNKSFYLFQIYIHFHDLQFSLSAFFKTIFS